MPNPDETLRAVRDDPEDIDRLFAHADALATAGDPLAELIRVQCEVDRGDLDRAAEAALRERARALIAAHEERWLGPLRAVVDHHCWYRGMLGLDVSVAGFLRRHADLVAAHAVRFIDVSDWSAALAPGAWQAFTACPDLRAVTLIGVRGRYTYDADDALLADADAALLAASPHARGLIGLDLGFNAIGDAGLAALARSPHLAGLHTLELRGCRYGDAGLQALAEEATFTGLTALDLSYCEGAPGDGAGWRALAASRRFPGLRRVRVAGSHLPDDARAALARRFAEDDER